MENFRYNVRISSWPDSTSAGSCACCVLRSGICSLEETKLQVGFKEKIFSFINIKKRNSLFSLEQYKLVILMANS